MHVETKSWGPSKWSEYKKCLEYKLLYKNRPYSDITLSVKMSSSQMIWTIVIKGKVQYIDKHQALSYLSNPNDIIDHDFDMTLMEGLL